jgi:rSAM/selenodomain-associated transferase 2
MAVAVGEGLYTGRAECESEYDESTKSNATPACVTTVPLSKTPKLTVVIPMFNEGKRAYSTLIRLLARADNPKSLEVIVVDGGSEDNTLARLHEGIDEVFSLYGVTVRVLFSSGGRGSCIQAGAQEAHGDSILMLHADTLVPQHFDTRIADALVKNPNISVGAFQFGFRLVFGTKFQRACMNLVRIGANLRSKYLGLPYGDQALFCSREMYDQIGGINALPLMEDFDFVRRAKKHGDVHIVNTEAVTSVRRWSDKGIVRVLLWNQIIVIAYALGVPADTLFRWYYGQDP